jgi:hypothetical protein
LGIPTLRDGFAIGSRSAAVLDAGSTAMVMGAP